MSGLINESSHQILNAVAQEEFLNDCERHSINSDLMGSRFSIQSNIKAPGAKNFLFKSIIEQVNQESLFGKEGRLRMTSRKTDNCGPNEEEFRLIPESNHQEFQKASKEDFQEFDTADTETEKMFEGWSEKFMKINSSNTSRMSKKTNNSSLSTKNKKVLDKEMRTINETNSDLYNMSNATRQESTVVNSNVKSHSKNSATFPANDSFKKKNDYMDYYRITVEDKENKEVMKMSKLKEDMKKEEMKNKLKTNQIHKDMIELRSASMEKYRTHDGIFLAIITSIIHYVPMLSNMEKAFTERINAIEAKIQSKRLPQESSTFFGQDLKKLEKLKTLQIFERALVRSPKNLIIEYHDLMEDLLVENERAVLKKILETQAYDEKLESLAAKYANQKLSNYKCSIMNNNCPTLNSEEIRRDTNMGKFKLRSSTEIYKKGLSLQDPKRKTRSY